MKSHIKFILKSFLFWRIFLLAFLFLFINVFPLQNMYLGGGMENYLNNPYLWSHANFDGEHFISISQSGYQPLSYFFFPLYPILINFFAGPFVDIMVTYLYSGLFLSHLFLFLGLVGLYKLIKLDFKENIAKLSVVLLLIFPTSFYLGSLYSESLFLSLCVWAFYFARKNNFLLAGVLTALATATRVVGVALLIPIFYEFLIQRKNSFNFKNILGILISPLGILSYMSFLWFRTGDALIFFNKVGIFGEQRSSSLILLPQVFYRYIFKILPNLNYSYFPSYFVGWLEFAVSVIFLIIIILSFKKIRLSYWFFMLFAYLIPTLAGSFSSMPRYVLILFPAFIFIAIYLTENKILRFIFFSVSLATLTLSYLLFVRGYWLS